MNDFTEMISRAERRTLAPEDAAVVLGAVARRLEHTLDSDEARKLTISGRRIATQEVVDVLLNAASNPRFDRGLLAGALRLRGVGVVGALLNRLDSADAEARRPFEEIAVRLAEFPELRETVVGSLRAAVRAAA